MGLDMYLSKRKWIGANYQHRKINGSIEIKQGRKTIPVEFSKITYVIEEVGYWRKANAIHNWFVNNVQKGVDDCREYYVPTEKLEQLLNICKEIKKKAKMKKGQVSVGQTLKEGRWIPILEDGEYIENVNEIAPMLPTTDGCFFGSTNYDEFYMDDINRTIEMLEKELKEEKKNNKKGLYSDYYYQSSW